VNPRGSTSYGADFGNVIQYHYPGDDYADLMRAVDDLLSRGFVDRDRLGVTGGSGGGLLTNWIIGHTDRFHAAVSQRSIADWEAMVVCGRLHAVSAKLVPQGALAGSRRLRGAVADYVRRRHSHAADARRRRRRLPHAADRGR
jgi:poly(3-hydroxybutyrate) depolymerase